MIDSSWAINATKRICLERQLRLQGVSFSLSRIFFIDRYISRPWWWHFIIRNVCPSSLQSFPNFYFWISWHDGTINISDWSTPFTKIALLFYLRIFKLHQLKKWHNRETYHSSFLKKINLVEFLLAWHQLPNKKYSIMCLLFCAKRLTTAVQLQRTTVHWGHFPFRTIFLAIHLCHITPLSFVCIPYKIKSDLTKQVSWIRI